MKIRSVVLLVVLALIAVFAALNWTEIMRPTPLSLGVVAIELPLGLVLLGAIVTLTIGFLVYILYQQASLMRDLRRWGRDLQAQRELADRAEASRFTELRTYLEGELGRLNAAGPASVAPGNTDALAARLDRLDRELRAHIDQAGDTLAAYIGELEDRLERGGAPGEPHA